jgi:phosphoribosyl 1,2-cyclic phosphodiesterase
MWVRFWGTRGSIPAPGPFTLRYGGNTTCVEVRTASDTLLVFDCGSGARALGASLMSGERSPAPEHPLRGHLFLSHFHWDHIQGMPFFTPLYAEGGEWHVYGPRPGAMSLREALALQMSPPFFPISLESLGSRLCFHELGEGVFAIGDVRVASQFLNHPGPTLGYRIEADGVAVVYVCDHEPHGSPIHSSTQVLEDGDLRHIAFLDGADLVIHDAQYMGREFEQRRGWGHSVGEYVIEVCRRAGVRRVALTHHDPTRTDAMIEASVEELRRRYGGSASPLEIFAAAEGDQIELGGMPPRARTLTAPPGSPDS